MEIPEIWTRGAVLRLRCWVSRELGGTLVAELASLPADLDGSAVLSRAPVERLEALFDTESLLIEEKADAVVCGRGTVGGITVADFATDLDVRGGALDAAASRAVAGTIQRAVRDRCAAVVLWHSAVAKLQDGVESLDGMGQLFVAMTAASGRVPQISVALGAAAGGAAYGTAQSDIVIAAPEARMFVTGPAVVREVTDHDLDAAALVAARRLVALITGIGRPMAMIHAEPQLEEVVATSRRRPYDVNPLVRLLLDEHEPPVVLHPHWAPNVATWLGALGGRPVGVLANNPLRLGGCLDGRGAKLLHAFAEATVPRFTLIKRKAYGGAYIAMNSRSLGADTVLAWPGAEIDVMGPEAAVQVVHRKALAALPAEERASAAAELVQRNQPEDGLLLAPKLGVVEQVIEPSETRTVLAELLAEAGARRGHHGNIPL